jgi:hypothetical protein
LAPLRFIGLGRAEGSHGEAGGVAELPKVRWGSRLSVAASGVIIEGDRCVVAI